MKKKINCKHGLDKKQEIQARRIRAKLEQYDTQILEKYHKVYVDWYEAKEKSFVDFLKEQDIVFYSAYARITERVRLQQINERIMYYGVPSYYGHPIK